MKKSVLIVFWVLILLIFAECNLFERFNPNDPIAHPELENDNHTITSDLIPPTNVRATNGDFTDKIRIQWDSVNGVEKYYIYRSITGETGEYLMITNINAPLTVFDDTDGIIIGGDEYYYKVQSYNTKQGLSNYSSIVKGRKAIENLLILGNYGTIKTITHLEKQWYYFTGNTGNQYNIYWNDNQGTLNANIRVSAYRQDKTTVYFYNIDNGYLSGQNITSSSDEIIYLRIEDFGGGGNFNIKSEPVLNNPTGISATDGTYNDEVKIAWNKVNHAERYDVYRSPTENGTYNKIGEANDPQLYYDDTSIPEFDTYYYYKIKAYSSKAVPDYTDFSNTDSGYKSVTAPTYINATDSLYTDKIVVSWNEVSGALSYDVYRSDTESGTYNLLNNTTLLTYDDSTGTPGAVYYYKFKVKTTLGDSEFSISDSGSIKLSTPLYSGFVSGTVYASNQQASLSINGNGSIYYNLISNNGSAPSDPDIPTTSSSLYSSSVNITATSGQTMYYKIKAVGYDDANLPGVVSNTWSLIIDKQVPSIPSISNIVSGTTYGTDQTFILSSSDLSGYSIYYTMSSQVGSTPADPADPTSASSLYSGAVPLTASIGDIKYYKIKAVAYDAVNNISDIGGVWTVIIDKEPPAVPILGNVSSGSSYNTDQTFTLSSTGSTSIYYAITSLVGSAPADPADPTSGSSSYSSAVSLTANSSEEKYYKIKAIAYDAFNNASSIAGVWTVIIDKKAPSTPLILGINPGETYGTNKNFKLLSTDASAINIYYTLTSQVGSAPSDPSDPTTASTLYAGSVSLSSNSGEVKYFKIKARAYDAFNNPSSVGGIWNVILYKCPSPGNMILTNGSVNTMVMDKNYLWIGGEFTRIGGYQHGAQLDISTGNLKSGVSHPQINGSVYCVIPDGSGGWIIGGNFSKVNDSERKCLARINADGSLHSWNPGITGNYIGVQALLLSGSTVYIGGGFFSVNSTTRNCLAAVDLSTGNLTSWDPNTGSSSGVVRTLAINGSIIYAGGNFTTVNSQTRNHIAAIDASTGIPTAWNPNSNGIVYSLVINGSYIYAGGSFGNIGGQSRTLIAQLDLSTGNATTWNANVTTGSKINSIAISGTVMYIGGIFTYINSTARNNVAALNLSNASLTSWDPNASGSSTEIYSLAVNGSIVYAGGIFYSIGGQNRSCFAAINTSDGLAVSSWDPNPDYSVRCMAINGTTLYTGGDFMSICGKTRLKIAQIDMNTGNVTSWTHPFIYYINGAVKSLSVTDNKVYVGGNFTQFDTTTVNCLAVFNKTTGALIKQFNANNEVLALTINSGNLYIGGAFTQIDGQTRNRIASINTATDSATTWNPNSQNTVRTLSCDGDLVYAGGDFTSIGGQSRSYIAALNTVNNNASSWNPVNNSNVLCLAVDENAIYAGGYFNQIGNPYVTRNGIASIEKFTGNILNWNPNADNVVRCIFTGENSIYAVGDFSTIGGATKYSIAEISKSTGNATSLNTVNPQYNYCYSICTSGSTVFIGCEFITTGIPNYNCFNGFATVDSATGNLW